MYTAGDCYLENSDWGYGEVLGTSPVCAATPMPGSRLMALIPRTGGSSYYEANYNEVWTAVGTQHPLPAAVLLHDHGHQPRPVRRVRRGHFG